MPVAMMLDEVRCRPVEERAMIADAILQTLNPVDPGIQQEWRNIAERRRSELLSGKVSAIATSDVLAEAYSRALA